MIDSKKLENKRFVTITNNSKATLHGVPPNESTSVETDAAGIPLQAHWRRRLRDAHIDKCVTITTKLQDQAVLKPNKAKTTKGVK